MLPVLQAERKYTGMAHAAIKRTEVPQHAIQTVNFSSRVRWMNFTVSRSARFVLVRFDLVTRPSRFPLG